LTKVCVLLFVFGLDTVSKFSAANSKQFSISFAVPGGQKMFYCGTSRPIGRPKGRRHKPVTWGLAQYGRTEAVFQLLFFNVAFVRAGQTSLNFCS
jgi:hypothetical protein